MEKLKRKSKRFYICVPLIKKHSRRSGRAVDCTGLENRQGVKAFGGSNPSSSANKRSATFLGGIFVLWHDHQAFSLEWE